MAKVQVIVSSAFCVGGKMQVPSKDEKTPKKIMLDVKLARNLKARGKVEVSDEAIEKAIEAEKKEAAE